jgi:hypothetical protein
MDVGIQMIFSTYGWPGMRDREAWHEEIRLARLADEPGFDVIWSVEHHFFDYSFCPDNTQLGTAAAVHVCPPQRPTTSLQRDVAARVSPMICGA